MAYGGAVVAAMKDNHFFPGNWGDPGLNWPVLNASCEGFRDSYQAALAHDSHKIALRTEARRNFTDLLKRTATYVEFTANGNTEMLHSSGFEMRPETTRSPATAPGPVLDLRGNPTEHSGRIELHATRTPGAQAYEMQSTTIDPSTMGDNPGWAHHPVLFSVQRIIIDNLPVGFVWVRLRAANSIGFGPWCSPVRVLVL
ncbi:MAG: hypothetical protein AB3X44_04850 [Leptothrix sp. (in: b-proteobacteria)]